MSESRRPEGSSAAAWRATTLARPEYDGMLGGVERGGTGGHDLQPPTAGPTREPTARPGELLERQRCRPGPSTTSRWTPRRPVRGPGSGTTSERVRSAHLVAAQKGKMRGGGSRQFGYPRDARGSAPRDDHGVVHPAPGDRAALQAWWDAADILARPVALRAALTEIGQLELATSPGTRSTCPGRDAVARSPSST